MDDSSIDILEFFESDDDSLFHPRQRSRKKAKGVNSAESRSISPKKSKETKDKKKKPKRKRRAKPADMPRRPLSAYNIYFREQRALIIGAKPPNLEDIGSPDNDSETAKGGSPPNFQRKKRAHRKTHGKISFSNLAKEIGKSWNELPQDQRAPFVAGAAKEKERYQKELKIYRLHKKEQEQKNDESTKVEKMVKKEEIEPQAIHPYRTKEKRNQEGRRFGMRGEPRSYYHHRTIARNHNDHATDYSHGTSSAVVSPSSHYGDRTGESSYSSHEHEYAYHPNNSGYEPRESREHRSPRTGMEANTHSKSQYDMDSINPLPLTYDANHHEEEHIHEDDMIKFVSPLLKKKSSRSRRKRLPTMASYYRSEHEDRDGYSVNNFSEDSKPSSIVSPQGRGSYQNDYHDYHHYPHHPVHHSHHRSHHPHHSHHQSSHDNMIGSEPDIPDYYAAPRYEEGEGRRMSGEYRHQDHDYSDIASGIFSL